MTETNPEFIYKITTLALWNDVGTNGVLEGMPIDKADGYMHFSTADQLRETLRLHFKGQTDLMLLSVRTQDVEGDLKWEPSRGGELFPHLYAELATSSVVRSDPISVAADGGVDLPEFK